MVALYCDLKRHRNLYLDGWTDGHIDRHTHIQVHTRIHTYKYIHTYIHTDSLNDGKFHVRTNRRRDNTEVIKWHDQK